MRNISIIFSLLLNFFTFHSTGTFLGSSKCLPRYPIMTIQQIPHSAALLALAAGIVSHLFYFRIGEHHLHGILYIQLFILANAVGTISLIAFNDATRLDAAITVSKLAASWLLGVYGSLITYRCASHMRFGIVLTLADCSSTRSTNSLDHGKLESAIFGCLQTWVICKATISSTTSTRSMAATFELDRILSRSPTP